MQKQNITPISLLIFYSIYGLFDYRKSTNFCKGNMTIQIVLEITFYFFEIFFFFLKTQIKLSN